MVYEAIRELVRYGLEKGLITEDDAIYARNQILEVLKMDEYEEPEKDGELTGAALEMTAAARIARSECSKYFCRP